MTVDFKNVLFPTDFSELAQAALPFSRSLVDSYDGQLHCLHVVDDAYQYWTAMGPESIPVGPPPENLIELATQRMEEFKQEHLGELGHEVLTAIRTGRPFAEIITYARDENVDLIVMGTHGRGAIAHMLLGSTTEKVVRKAPCAVMTVRAPDQAFEMP